MSSTVDLLSASEAYEPPPTVAAPFLTVYVHTMPFSSVHVSAFAWYRHVNAIAVISTFVTVRIVLPFFSQEITAFRHLDNNFANAFGSL